MIILFLLPASLDLVQSDQTCFFPNEDAIFEPCLPVLVRKYTFSPSFPLWKELSEAKSGFYITKIGKRLSGLFSGRERMEKDPFLLRD